MAKVLLDSGDSYVAASNASIYGGAGSETIKVLDGVVVTTDANIERVELPRASSAYTYKATTSGVDVIYNGNAVGHFATGEKVAFTDGSASIAATTTTVNGVLTVGFTLGGQTVTTAGGALTPTLSTATGEASTITTSTTTTPTNSTTFALTSGTDNFSATSTPALTTASETITSSLNTLTSGDSIVDPSTTDSDTLTAELVNNVDSTVRITNIENLTFKPLSGTRTVDNTLITGVKTIESAGTGGLTLTNVQSAATTYKMTGTSSDLSITPLASLLTGANDTTSVTLNGTTAGTLTVNGGVETIALTSSGSAQNVLTNVVSPLSTTLTIGGGAGFKNTSAIGSNFTTVDARNAGAVDLQLTSNSTLTALTGSTDDKITLTGALASGELIAMGAGTNTLVLKDSTGGAQATLTGVTNVNTTDAAATNIDLTNANQAANVSIGAAATSVNVSNLLTGSTVVATATPAIGAASSISFKTGQTNTVLNLNLQKGMSNSSGGWTFTNVGDLTVTGGTADTTLGSTTLTTTTTKLTLVDPNSYALTTGAITASSKVTDLTATSSGTGTTTVTSLVDATSLTNLTVNATSGSVILGAIGSTTASGKLNNITINATKDVQLGTIGVANSGNIASVTLNANGGQISAQAPLTALTSANTSATADLITNTGGDITTVSITGNKPVEIGLKTVTAGKVVNVASTDTASTYIYVTDAITTGTGTTVTLGNASTGNANVVTLNTVGNHTITGGSGVDGIVLAATYGTAAAADSGVGNIINLSNSTYYLDSNTNNTASNNVIAAGKIATLATASTVDTATTALVSTVSGVENITVSDGVNVIVGSSANNVFNIKNASTADTVISNGGDDSITVVAGGSNPTATFIFGSTLNSSDTIADNSTGAAVLTFTDGNNASTDLDNVTFAGNVTITLGNAVTNVTTKNASFTNASTITVDGSALTGTNTLTWNGAAEADSKFSVTGGAGNDTITAGAAGDTINGGAGADTITLGAGTDVVRYTATTDAGIAGTLTAAQGDTVTSFTEATDKIAFTSGLLFSGLTHTTSNAANAIANAAGLNLTAAAGLKSVQIITGAAGNVAVAADVLNITKLAAAIGALTNEAVGQQNIMIFNDNAHDTAGVYLFTASGTTGTLVAGDLRLLGVVTTSADIAAGDLQWT